jgi:hypothetical protein
MRTRRRFSAEFKAKVIKVGSRRAESRCIVSAFCFPSSSFRSAFCNYWLRKQTSLAFLSSEVRRRVSETPPEDFNIIPLGVLSFEVPRAPLAFGCAAIISPSRRSARCLTAVRIDAQQGGRVTV